MQDALARHDALARAAVTEHRGTSSRWRATASMQLSTILSTRLRRRSSSSGRSPIPRATNGIRFRVRCGLHAGVAEGRDNDYLRQHRQPRGPDHERRARRPGAALASGGGARRMTAFRRARRSRDLGSVRLRDLAHPEHVHQLVHPELRHDFPALRSLEATPQQPAAAVHVVHRPRARARGSPAAPAPVPRLLTLIGLGGIGKTRLVAAGRRRRDGRVSGRNLVRRSGAGDRSRRWCRRR